MEKVANPRRLAGRMKYLKRQQRRLSRKVKGSNRWRRQKRVVACAHEARTGQTDRAWMEHARAV